MSGELLQVDEVSAGYGSARALDGVRLSVAASSALAVLGPNGAGKSTLARVLTGLVPATAGRIVFDGKDVTRWPAYRRRRIGLVSLPEQRAVFPSLTVRENLRMATCQLPGRRAREEEIALACERFPVLGSRHQQLAGQLSGGEQQMLSLARTLAMRPRLIIADEISHGLAPRLVDMAFAALTEARAQGIAVLAIEQFVHRALGLADTCVIMERGAITWAGSPEDAGAQLQDRYLGA